MTALAAVSPAPVRSAAAPSDDSARDGNGGGFAAALDVACEPTPGHAKSLPARTEARTAAAKSGTGQAARDDDAWPDGETGTDQPAPDLALLLPGWPPAVEAAPVDGPSAPMPPHAARTPGDAGSCAATAAAAGLAAIAAKDLSATPSASGPAQAHTARLPAATTPAPPGSTGAAAPMPPELAPAAVDRPRASGSQGAAPTGIEAAPARNGKPDADTAATGALPASASAALGAAAPMRAAVGAPFEAHLAAALDSPGFAPALASQVTWLIHEGQQHARLTLNPADMGPVSVKIVLDGSQARVDFSVDMASTRTAIEASLPVLAAALHDSGLTLAGGGVFDGQSRHGSAEDRSPGRHGPASAAAPSPGDAAPALPQRAARGLVDLVA